MSYNAGDLLDKTFKAKGRVPLYHAAYDNETPYTYVEPGQIIGVLYSWLSPTAGRTGLWWMFYDQDNKPYYVPHKEGGNYIDESFFKDQGVLTTEEKIEKENEANESLPDKLIRNGKNIVLTLGAGYLLIKLIKN